MMVHMAGSTLVQLCQFYICQMLQLGMAKILRNAKESPLNMHAFCSI